MIDPEFGQQLGLGQLVDLQDNVTEVQREWLGQADERGAGDRLDLVSRRRMVEASCHGLRHRRQCARAASLPASATLAKGRTSKHAERWPSGRRRSPGK